jgi:hypothetical protein
MSGAQVKSPQRTVQEIEVEQATMSTLRREAARRDISVDRLISSLLNAVAADGLVNAVLDDEVSTVEHHVDQ